MKTTDNYKLWSLNEYKFYENICEENKLFIENEKNHYSDIGCICQSCSLKRNNIIEDIKINKPIKSYIIEHDFQNNNANKNVCLIHMFYDNNIIKNTFVIF